MLKHLQTRDQWDEKNIAEKGFTLIELLVVIIILGILAGVAIFAIGGVRDKAETNACKSEEDTVQVAIEAYALANDEKPADVDLGMLTAAGPNQQLKQTPKYWGVGAGKPVRNNVAAANCT